MESAPVSLAKGLGLDIQKEEKTSFPFFWRSMLGLRMDRLDT